jgi:insertion element IS1 protein InsB
MEKRMKCPYCNEEWIVKNGSNSVGTPKFLCRHCNRQFVENPKKTFISEKAKQLIDKLLLERISLAGIARVIGVSEVWLQNYVNHLYASTPHEINVIEKTNINLTIECDEIWSFVKNHDTKQWVWLAIDRDTREIVGTYIGDRSRDSAQELWLSLPSQYQQCAICYTDYWEAYKTVIPDNQHHSVGKETGLTNHIERFNNTLRQRVSRLVRKSLSFSKKLENHIGAIWYFIRHYNDNLRGAFNA